MDTDKEKKPEGNEDGEKSPVSVLRRGNPNSWLIALIVMGTLALLLLNTGPQRSNIREDFFEAQLQQKNIAEITYLTDTRVVGLFKEAPNAPAKYDKQGKLVQPPKEKGKPKKTAAVFLRRARPTNERRAENAA